MVVVRASADSIHLLEYCCNNRRRQMTKQIKFLRGYSGNPQQVTSGSGTQPDKIYYASWTPLSFFLNTFSFAKNKGILTLYFSIIV